MTLKPTVEISNFLSKEERDTLFDTICVHQKQFQYLSIPDEHGGGSLHLSLGPETSDRSELEPLRKACECLSNGILKLLPKVFDELGIEPFPVSQIPLSITNGLNGHTGAPHADESGGRFKISVLYYLHNSPKAFHGGDFELYKTDSDSPKGHKEQAFVHIKHQDNLLVAFPSATYHGVTDVTLDSTEFEDGRFVIVGFLG
jgi:hypothetical protein